VVPPQFVGDSVNRRPWSPITGAPAGLTVRTQFFPALQSVFAVVGVRHLSEPTVLCAPTSSGYSSLSSLW